MPMEAKFSDWILIYENILSETKSKFMKYFVKVKERGRKNLMMVC